MKCERTDKTKCYSYEQLLLHILNFCFIMYFKFFTSLVLKEHFNETDFIYTIFSKYTCNDN